MKKIWLIMAAMVSVFLASCTVTETEYVIRKDSTDPTNPLEIELSIPETLSNADTTVTVKVTSASEIKRVVYKKNGSENPAKLLADEEALECQRVKADDDSLWTFKADEKTYWTVAAIDEAGRWATEQIYAKTIDVVPPAEVSNVLSQYIKALNSVSISWTDPSLSGENYDSPFDHVVITYTIDDSAEEFTVPQTFAKGTEAAIIEGIEPNAEVYTFFIHSVDELGNVSAGVRSKLYISNITYAAASDVADKIADLTQSGTVKVTGTISSSTIYTIKTALSNLEEGILVKLDLEETTSLTEVSRALFENVNNLSEIIIPDTVIKIGDYAFKNCVNLVKIGIPDSVTSIGYEAFYGCTSLASVDISDSVTSIGYGAFKNCTSLTSVEIPDSVTSIGNDAFRDCTSLASVDISDSVTSIGSGVFSNCTSLASVDISDSVTSIGNNAFRDCTSLASVDISDSVTSIGDYAFADCTSLASVDIPDSVTSIGYEEFKSCTSLTSVEIPDSVTSIGARAFFNCTSLASVEIPNGVTSIGGSAFWGCTSLSSISYVGTVEQWKAITKVSDWNGNVPATKVVCSDGEVGL